ncbi:amidohydrolase family protein [Telluribacter sp.]|jgi:predicted TIM-barrel fold metal-dependent hydrolase|uniref:amidohydrolase family protein n=1 Tax=Telluribacter sp. TaxID=1978767 RepID=UPI002E0E4D5F|nr:amidohydrolase family protein [Telluribacter sp.]
MKLSSTATSCFLTTSLLVFFALASVTDGQAQNAQDLKLKNYRPVSIYKVPQSRIAKARYPAIDLHAHDYPKTDAEVDAWVKTMDAAGISKSVVLSYATGAAFDAIAKKYTRYPDRFEVWCGFDYTGADQPGWEQKAVAELVRCHKMGARGVGELGDKGLGELYSKPTPGYGIHIDDPRMKPLLAKCAELRMPISIHVAEDAWMYQKPDSTNDGLMNSAKWNVDMSKPGILDHDQLVGTLENAVRDNPKTTFIACHLANCNADLTVLGRLFDRYTNLYADVSARYAEFAPIPRFAGAFMEKYANRIVYGTDMGTSADMYHTTFRILESADEHFYEHNRFGYHWPLYGLALSDPTLKKIYSTNALKLLAR